MNIILWILQILFGIYFIFIGFVHFNPPPNLPSMMQWMYELPQGLHYFSGTAEILGGLGLMLPGLFKIRTQLVPLAALGLAVVMLGAVVFHLTRGEVTIIVINLLNAAILAFIAYGRWRIHPIPERLVPTGQAITIK